MTTDDFTLDVTPDDATARSITGGDAYATVPVALRIDGELLRTDDGRAFEVGEFALTFLPRLLDALDRVADGESVALSFHATSVAIEFERDDDAVVVGAELGADATERRRVEYDAFVAGVVTGIRQFLDRLEAVDDDALADGKLAEIDRDLVGWERRIAS